MNPLYPVFVKDRKDRLRIFDSLEELQKTLSVVNFQTGGYAAWDMRGYRLELRVSEGRAHIRTVSELPESIKLIDAIVAYLNMSERQLPVLM